jgi:hypothetical protein
MAGPVGMLGGPFIAVFAWFFLPLEWLASWAQLRMYTVQKRSFRHILVLSSICAAITVASLGPKDSAEGIKMVVAYALAGASAAALSAFIIRLEYRNEN